MFDRAFAEKTAGASIVEAMAARGSTMLVNDVDR